ncbi:MAG: DUF3303 domain-containing protein [Methanoregulaceae archaeon]|jgi:hypothetical protein|nr:DUF3303 domain-containing protein [Methanoregulaceae archaeon]
MLFMSMFQWEPGKTGEIIEIRQKEQLPPGLKIVKEWVALETNIVFRLLETNDPVALLKASSSWADLGYIDLHPVMESEDALRCLCQ